MAEVADQRRDSKRVPVSGAGWVVSVHDTCQDYLGAIFLVPKSSIKRCCSIAKLNGRLYVEN